MTSQTSAARSAPVVAVLLSTYNGAAYLPEQLDSLAAQEGVEVRLHVRDDGSSDATLDVLRSYAHRWPNLLNVHPGANLGPAASFLELLRTAESNADFYAFCDQDDVWLTRKLARAIEALANDQGPALYCSNLTCVSADLTTIGTPRPNGDPRLEHLLYENIATGCTVVMNPAARALVNERPPEYGVIMHDWWCALVVAAHGGSIRYDPEPSLLYRQHRSNSVGSSASQLGQMLLNAKRLLHAPQHFYLIHAQAAELLRLYNVRIDAPQLGVLRQLVQSKHSTWTRLRLALSGPVTRSRVLDSLAARVLIALNRH